MPSHWFSKQASASGFSTAEFPIELKLCHRAIAMRLTENTEANIGTTKVNNITTTGVSFASISVFSTPQFDGAWVVFIAIGF